jgi:hypothetical protein
MNNDFETTPTGRRVNRHAELLNTALEQQRALVPGPVLHSHRTAMPRFLSPKQQAILDGMEGDTVTLAGRTLTRQDLGYIFSGQQIPKDPELCKLLDLDYGAIEERITASMAPDSPHPYGS